MFLDNKYSKIYFNLIDRARKLERTGYLEKHHVIPKSLGGTNAKENLNKLKELEIHEPYNGSLFSKAVRSK